jgi:ferredoxin
MDIPTNRIARESGLVDPEDIELVGDVTSAKGAEGFVLPTHLRSVRAQMWLLNHLPGALAGMASRLFSVKPLMTPDCIACGECVEKCPAGALALADGKVALDARACIGCMCCREVCPHDAIDVRRSLLARLMGR